LFDKTQYKIIVIQTLAGTMEVSLYHLQLNTIYIWNLVTKRCISGYWVISWSLFSSKAGQLY